MSSSLNTKTINVSLKKRTLVRLLLGQMKLDISKLEFNRAYIYYVNNSTYLAVLANPSKEGYYNRNNPLVEGVPPHIQRPSPARWRLVNMWGRPFYQGIISVITWVPPHI